MRERAFEDAIDHYRREGYAVVHGFFSHGEAVVFPVVATFAQPAGAAVHVLTGALA